MPKGKPSKIKKKVFSKKVTSKRIIAARTAGKAPRKPSQKLHPKKPIKLSPAMNKLRKELVDDKNQLIKEIVSMQEETLKKSSKDASGDLSSYSYHMADMASDLYDREFLLSLAEGERERLLSLDEAIRKIEEGTYGKCEMCGCPIPKERLAALPQAQHCVKCQEKHEKIPRS
jgi:RNA polymerase-binding protein DksA